MREIHIEECLLGDHKCTLFSKGEFGPIFVWGYYPHRGDTLTHMAELLQKDLMEKDFILAAFEVADWNRDFSPWPAPNCMENESPFAGGGIATLEFLEKVFLPYLSNKYPDHGGFCTMGYSLAGLFSLWSLYASKAFQGAICCSGSIWFEGFIDFVKKNDLKNKAAIYLSLGGKEEKTTNAILSSIGACTRDIAAFYKKDPQVMDSVLEWNSGGHFADSAKRLIKGMKWILNEANFGRNEH